MKFPVSDVVPAFLDRCRRGWFPWLLGAGLAAGSLPEVSAHDLYTAYIQHRVHLNVGARHVDLTLDLTFFEEWSSRERRKMDANTNGLVARVEVERYLKALAPDLVKQVRLLVAGREVPLVSLDEPEVDLLGSDQAGPGHHRLRLFFFAPTPPGLRAADAIVIEDRLWPEAKGLGTVYTEGSDGCALEPEKPSDPGFAPARSGEARVFRVKCLKPPTAQPAAHNTARPTS